MNYPSMYRIRQKIDAPEVTDIEGVVASEIAALGLGEKIAPGASVAVTAGSRGIANIDRIIAEIVRSLKAVGASPFIVPSMGSHGGASAEGQVEVLGSLGITEEAVGAPIRSSMEVVEIGRSEFGYPVLVDRIASEADGIVVVNRIKPHTEFEGPVESGLMKMLAIGLGNHAGAFQVHQQTVIHGYRKVIPAMGKMILEKLPLLFGVGIVENIYDRTAMIRALPGDELLAGEVGLLAEAKQLMARLPVENLDVLVIDEMGKNISGTGMDTNVIGRIMFVGEEEPPSPSITRIAVLDLTEPSHGNAVGIGLADFTTRRLVDKIDLHKIAVNSITAMTPEKGRIPIALETDRAVLDACIETIGAVPLEKARIAHVRNTLEIGQLDVSETVYQELSGRSDLELVEALGPLYFDENGGLGKVPGL